MKPSNAASRAAPPGNNAEIAKAFESDPVSRFMAEEGLDPVGSTPEELASLLQREIVKYAAVIKQAQIKLSLLRPAFAAN